VAQGVLRRVERPLQHELQKLLTVLLDTPAGLGGPLEGRAYDLIYEVGGRGGNGLRLRLQRCQAALPPPRVAPGLCAP
jgi:hypothetical protein